MLGQHASTSTDDLYTYTFVLGELLEQIVGVPIGDSTNLTIQQGHVVKKTVGNYYINTDDCKIYKC
ncbi:MAG: hypothetical protein ACRCXX_08100, partial [Cetobacterium sp.]|uniref:hypothetical protein n=1 Tax=Cetobacterium sp. TaxID=2071632 RepID=UPI003F3F0ACB